MPCGHLKCKAGSGRCSASTTRSPVKQHRTTSTEVHRQRCALGTSSTNHRENRSCICSAALTAASASCTDLESSLSTLSAALNVLPYSSRNGGSGRRADVQSPGSTSKQRAFLKLLNASLSNDLIPASALAAQTPKAAVNAGRNGALARPAAGACKLQQMPLSNSKAAHAAVNGRQRRWEASAQPAAERAASADLGTLRCSQMNFARAKSAPAELQSPFSRAAFGQGFPGSNGAAKEAKATPGPCHWQALEKEVSNFVAVLGIDCGTLLEDILISAF